MQYSVQQFDSETRVNCFGEFLSQDWPNIQPMAEDIFNRPSGRVVLDLSGLDEIDSAGLSMLLFLRKFAEKESKTVVLSRPSPNIREMLDLACFEIIFEIC